VEWFEDEELALVADTIDDFAAREIEGKVVDLERLGRPPFPHQAVDALADLGFLWGIAPEDLGIGMDDVTAVVLLSKLAETSAGFAAIVAVHYAAVGAVLSSPSGMEVLKGLKGLKGGNGSRSAGAALIGVALRSETAPLGTGVPGSRYVAMPSHESTDFTLLLAEGGPDAAVLLADREAAARLAVEGPGVSGLDEMSTSVLAAPGDSLDAMEFVVSGSGAVEVRDALMSSLRLYFSAIMQGSARSATAYALEYAKQRHQTGRAIIHHQNVRKKLNEMETANQAMASFLYRAASNGAGNGASGLRGMLYDFTKAQSEYVVNEAIQGLGGYGYMREYGLEKKLRDVKALQALGPSCTADWLGLF